MGKFAHFFENLGQHIKDIWAHEPQVEADVTAVISGVTKVVGALNSPEADIIASMFPNGIGNKTLAEVKAIIPQALDVSHVAEDALTASDGLTDPTAKANAVITTVLADVAKLQGAAKDAQLLLIMSGIVSKVLGITFAQATNLVSAKQAEMQAVPAAVA